jgi:hypothetical protein
MDQFQANQRRLGLGQVEGAVFSTIFTHLSPYLLHLQHVPYLMLIWSGIRRLIAQVAVLNSYAQSIQL